MSGLSQEYVASYLKGQVGNSGFNQSTISNYDSKYFDVYDELNNGTSYNYRILGDATGEMGPFENYTDDDGKNRFHNSWYKSLSIFINPSYSWIIRGTSYSHGILAGQFSFNTADGITHSNVSSRIVLTPTK